jgi:hypothetical protein
VVGGRLEQPSAGEGLFRTLDTAACVPSGFEDMFTALTEADFRVDLSSTQLRTQTSTS